MKKIKDILKKRCMKKKTMNDMKNVTSSLGTEQNSSMANSMTGIDQQKSLYFLLIVIFSY